MGRFTGGGKSGGKSPLLRTIERAAANHKKLTAYHGTHHEVDKFSSANIGTGEGVQAYGEGPDLTQRIQLEVEKLVDNLGDDEDALAQFLTDNNISETEYEREPNFAVEDFVKERMVGEAGDGVVYPVKINTENYVQIGGDSPTRLDEVESDIDRADYDDEDDYFADLENDKFDNPDGIYARVNEALIDAGVDDTAEIMDEVREALYNDEDGLDLAELDRIIRSAGVEAYDHADNYLTGGAISSRVFKELGFDGVIDKTVNQKFGSERGSGTQMEGMDYDTEHIITFPDKESKIRSVNAAFDPQFKNSRNLLGQADPKLLAGTAAVSGGALAAPLLLSDREEARNKEIETSRSNEAAQKKKAFLEKRAAKGSQRAIDKLAEIAVGTEEAIKTIGAGMANEAAAGLFGIAAAIDPRVDAAKMVEAVQNNPVIESTPQTDNGIQQLLGFAELIKDTSNYWSSEGQGGKFIDEQQAKNELTRGLEVGDNFNESADYLAKEVHPAAGVALKLAPEIVL